MTDYEWCKSICRVNGPALRTWLERFAPQTGATKKQIDKIVGLTGMPPAAKSDVAYGAPLQGNK